MALDIQPGEKQVRLAQSKPLAYALVVMVILVGILLTMLVKANSNNREDCQTQNKACAEDNRDLRQQVKELYGMVFAMNKQVQQVQHNTDSVIRQAIKPQFKKRKNEN